MKRRVRRKPVPLKRRLKDWRKRAGRVRRIVHATPPAVRTIVILALAATLFLLANLVYHVVRKPTEMLYPVSGVLKKNPAETWHEYGALFREYSTANISPELLAALAQTEGTGDPIAHTYWRWHLTWPPFEIYKPASSAVGMYQMTDGTFADAARYCIRNHVVIERDSGSCWSEDLYNRLLPSHAIELTAAHLDRSVAAILGRGDQKATAQQKQDLAALTHLCGAGAAREFARHGFRMSAGQMCGDHSAETYVGRVTAMVRQFQRLSAAD
ncbi:MAG TPA: hypothetical protein VKP60_10720 [Magnetospirillaceae bacterium]|nr:hypothetical protein [Magnetospirillaceae bacterium]